MTDWKYEHDQELSLRKEWSARAQKAEKLLRESRQYVADAGSDEDAETQRLSGQLLSEIDTALRETMPCTHEIWELDVAIDTDGYCPLCQAAEIAKLRAALTTCRLYVADEIIGAAIVVPAGEEPDARRHPSLLQMIDAALRTNEQLGKDGS